ncbi:hypothetical protein [Thiolapillus sp.]|nr:hypothetical protein [Thiolapillus sp.]
MSVPNILKILIRSAAIAGLSSPLIAGDLRVEGSVNAASFVGDGSQLTGVVTQAAPRFHIWVPRTGQTGCWDEDGASRDCTQALAKTGSIRWAADWQAISTGESLTLSHHASPTILTAP